MGKYRNKEYELENVSVFNEDTKFNGNMFFKNPIQIRGEYKGTINTDSILIISKDASVTANINSRILILEGILKGNVKALEKVDIQPSGRLFGNITTAKLKIADGVIFEGTCNMIKNNIQTSKIQEVQ